MALAWPSSTLATPREVLWSLGQLGRKDPQDNACKLAARCFQPTWFRHHERPEGLTGKGLQEILALWSPTPWAVASPYSFLSFSFLVYEPEDGKGTPMLRACNPPLLSWTSQGTLP